MNNYYPLNHYKIPSNVSLPEGKSRKSPCFSGILAVTSPHLRLSARTVPPEDLTPTDLADLASAEVATNPAKAKGGRCLDEYPLVN